jgi:uncharacterized membrane protein YfcA
MTPLMILLFGVHPATAAGSGLLHAAATKTPGTLVHGLNRGIYWRPVSGLAAGKLPTTALTLVRLIAFQRSQQRGAGDYHRRPRHCACRDDRRPGLQEAQLAFLRAVVGVLDLWHTTVLTVLLGVVLGTLVSISSVGAGALGVTAIILLYSRLPTARIVGSGIVHAVPLRASPALVNKRWAQSIGIYLAHARRLSAPALFSAAICGYACWRRHWVLPKLLPLWVLWVTSGGQEIRGRAQSSRRGCWSHIRPERSSSLPWCNSFHEVTNT